jgi:hypothetical protein
LLVLFGPGLAAHDAGSVVLQATLVPGGGLANAATDVQTPPAPPPNVQQPRAQKPDAMGQPGGLTDKSPLNVPLPMPDDTFYPSREVDRKAELLLPLEPDLFSDNAMLSGRLLLEILIRRDGTVADVRVLEAIDPAGALQKVILPWLKAAPFTPAFKDGLAVNSLQRIELALGIISKAGIGFQSGKHPAGQLPKLDARGNYVRE